MAKTFGEILDNSEPSEVETEEAQPEAEAAPAVEDDKPRNPDGTFAKKGDEEGAPPAPAEKQEFDGAATLAERRKRQEAEAELERLREQLKQPPQPDPDMFGDPDGWQQLQQNRTTQQVLNAKLDISEEVARDKFGDEIVDQARDWAVARFREDPAFYGKAMAQRNPYRFVVEEYQRDQIITTMKPEDIAAFHQWRNDPMRQAPRPAPEPPPSLTGERNVGVRSSPPDMGPSTFGEALNRR